MDKKTSWDDIPSLDLRLDNDEEDEGSIDKRSAVRMVSKDILSMLNENAKILYDRVATQKGILNKRGVLQDIHQGGLCFLLPEHGLKKQQKIKIQVMLGTRPFKSNAVVCWKSTDKVGIKYINPAPEDVSFLAELYSAKILNRV